MGMSIISNTHTTDTCAVCASEIDHFAFVSGGRALCAGCYLRLLDYAEQRATPKPTLRTAALTTQHEYALYVGDEPHEPLIDTRGKSYNPPSEPAEATELNALRVGDRVTFVNTAGTTYLCQIDAIRSGKIYAFGYAEHVPHQWFYQRVDQLPTLQRAEPGAAFPVTPDSAWVKQMRDDQLGDFDVKDDRPRPYCWFDGVDQCASVIR